MNITIRREPIETLAALVPFYEPVGLLDEIEELASELWGDWGPADFETGVFPHTEIHEENGELVVTAELPGMPKKGLDITLEGNTLTIKAEKKQERREKGDEHTSDIREQYYEQYVRSIPLPFTIDGDKVSATFRKGVLQLRLPRSEDATTKPVKVKLETRQPKKLESTTASSE